MAYFDKLLGKLRDKERQYDFSTTGLLASDPGGPGNSNRLAYTVPKNRTIKIVCIGGGGGGGAGAVGAAGTNRLGGGGGGAATFHIVTINTNWLPSDKLYIKTGAGGTGGIPLGNVATAGTLSAVYTHPTFSSSSYVVASASFGSPGVYGGSGGSRGISAPQTQNLDALPIYYDYAATVLSITKTTGTIAEIGSTGSGGAVTITPNATPDVVFGGRAGGGCLNSTMGFGGYLGTTDNNWMKAQAYPAAGASGNAPPAQNGYTSLDIQDPWFPFSYVGNDGTSNTKLSYPAYTAAFLSLPGVGGSSSNNYGGGRGGNGNIGSGGGGGGAGVTGSTTGAGGNGGNGGVYIFLL